MTGYPTSSKDQMITYRRLKLSEKERFAEVDRSERITEAYRQKGNDLETVDVEWDVPPWSLHEKLKEWDAFLKANCLLWGAFDGELLVGFCGYRPNIAPDTGQLTLLHVSKAYRRRGIGHQLAEMLMDHVREREIPVLYVAATPTRGTVDFYQSLGFRPTDKPLPELLEMEPDDIHMRMEFPSA
jgi:ribosomal protein S18 acetylase RimI-like enzyme